MRIYSATPVLLVADLERSMTWYHDVLGFERTWRDAARTIRIERDGVELLLSPQASTLQPFVAHAPWSVILYVSDLERVREQARTRDVRSVNVNDARLHAFEVQDPDGNVICIAQQPEVESSVSSPDSLLAAM